MFREVVINTEVNVEGEESEAQGLLSLELEAQEMSRPVSPNA